MEGTPTKVLDAFMDDKTLRALLAEGTERTYQPGELISGPDLATKEIFYVAEGLVRVYATNTRGEEYLHIIYRQGEFFPIAWIVSDVRRNMYFQALYGCKVVCIPRDVLTKKLQADGELCWEFTRRVAEQFTAYADRLDNLQYQYAIERVSYRLLFMASRFGVRQGKKIKLPYFSQQAIASSINLSRETVARTMDKLKERNIISYGYKGITLQDLDALSQEVKGGITMNSWGLCETNFQPEPTSPRKKANQRRTT